MTDDIMFETHPVAMWTFDPATRRITGANAAMLALYGYARDELAAVAVGQLAGEDPAVTGEALLREHRRKDGRPIAVEMTCAQADHQRLVIAVDVTAREVARDALRRTQEQLRHAQRVDALGRLVGGVVHDFNNIITVIQACAALVEETLDASDERRADIREIRQASARATKLTQQLLTLSRNDTAAPGPLLLDELLNELIPTLQRLLGAGVPIAFRRGSVLPVITDRGQLEQVVVNLAVNARDAMNGKGRLVIETSMSRLDADAAALRGLAAGRYAVIAVTDTGPGIPPEIQARIFEAFFTTKGAGKGTGLGLSIAQGILTAARGALEVYSQVGHGTTFRAWLPIAEGAELHPSRELHAISQPLRPVTVLFVDHEAELRAVVARSLRAAGCTVLEAANGTEARERCVTHEGTIEVAVVDIELSDGRGDVLARDLRELRPDLGVIVTSGFPAGSVTPSSDLPMLFLSKPFTPVQLRDAIASTTATVGVARRSEPTLLPRILIVDDDPALRRMLVRLLKRGSFEVTEVDSGRGALAEIGRQRFDVVVSDIHMPDGGGIELLRAVRRIDLDLPVILMSGKPDVETAAIALELGAFRYLTKPLDNDTLERTIRQAARAYALARIRREAVVVGGGRTGASDRAGLEVRFDQAMEQMWMAFQPIVHAESGALFGVEALMRSEEASLPTPMALLDAATQLGRLPALGRRTRGLSAAVVAGRPDIPTLFVNLHPEDLLDIQLIDPASPLTKIASRVILEVTERASLHTTPEVLARLARLRELGFRLAIDDIGAGYSGLTSFTDLTPEIVKLDMSLVRSIDTSHVKQRTVRALCALCHEMGATVVGEGVETPEERGYLLELGCDLLQGYLIARPSREVPLR